MHNGFIIDSMKGIKNNTETKYWRHRIPIQLYTVMSESRNLLQFH